MGDDLELTDYERGQLFEWLYFWTHEKDESPGTLIQEAGDNSVEAWAYYRLKAIIEALPPSKGEE